MNEEKIRKIVQEELDIALKDNNKTFGTSFDTKLTKLKNEFVREVGVAMEEFSSQMKTVAEFTQVLYENHEKRLVYIEDRILR